MTFQKGEKTKKDFSAQCHATQIRLTRTSKLRRQRSESLLEPQYQVGLEFQIGCDGPGGGISYLLRYRTNVVISQLIASRCCIILTGEAD